MQAPPASNAGAPSATARPQRNRTWTAPFRCWWCSPPGVTRKGGAPALHPRPSAPVARSQARYTWGVAAPPVSSHSSPRRCSLCSADAPRRSAALCRATGSADAPPVGRARALSLLGSTDLGAAQTVGTAALRSHACGSLHSPERRSTAAAAQLVRSAHQGDKRFGYSAHSPAEAAPAPAPPSASILEASPEKFAPTAMLGVRRARRASPRSSTIFPL